MYSEITAHFNCIDSAEYAARRVKASFNDILKMSIKYRNLKSHTLYDNDVEKGLMLAVPIDISSGISSNSVLPNILLADTSGFYSIRESDFSDESRLVILCNAKDRQKICNKLRCLGGINIKTANKNM